MDLNDKLKEFDQSIQVTLSKEYAQMDKMIEDEIQEGISGELEEYENKKKTSYEKNVQKIEKDFNKKLYNYEIQCKKQIIDEQNKMIEELKTEAISALKNYTYQNEYQHFLERCIEQSLYKVEDKNGTSIGLVKNDIDRFANIIEQKYNTKIIEIPENKIGGCILENQLQGIYIDNTILNNINEKLKGK